MPSLTAVEHLNAVVAERVVAASVNTDAVTDGTEPKANINKWASDVNQQHGI